jgi:hypothetical protein
MSKNPFEIRETLLNLSYNILSDRINNTRMRLEQDWSTQREMFFSGKTHASKPPEFPDLPSITVEEIIEEAKKLNDFVSKG